MSNSYKDYFDKAQKKNGLTNLDVKLPVKKLATTEVRKHSKARPASPNKPSRGLMLFSLFGLLVTGSGTFFYDEIEKLGSKLEIGLFSHALAEEAAKEPESKSTNSNKASKEASEGSSEKKVESKELSAGDTDEVELNHFARLRERKIELDKREETLNKMEAEILQQRTEVEQKLRELEDARRKISSVLEEKVLADEQKVENLVHFYSNMKPPQAAKIIESIDEDLAVQVISKMKKKNAADIMNLLKPEKAQAISEKYVGYRK